MISQISGKYSGQASGEIREAVRLHRDGHLDAARRIYSRILCHSPENSDALHLLGVIAHQAGEYDNAIRLISRAIQLTPEQASYYLNLGNAYRESNLLAQAVTCFSKAIYLNPDYAEAYFNIANTLFVQGELDSAVRNYEYALKLRPNLTEALLNLGEIFEQQGAPDKAIVSYRRALGLKPDCTDACVRLGSLYQKMNDHAQAIRIFKSALSANLPESYRIYNNMGVSHRALGRADDAVDCFQKALKLNPAYAPACYNLGIEYHLKGELKASIQFLERAVTLSPDHGDALNLLVHLLQRTCNWRKLEVFTARLDRMTEEALHQRRPAAEAVYSNVLRHDDPSLNYAVAQNRGRHILQKVAGIKANFRHAGRSADSDKITLGYFSADFRNHPIAHLTCGVFGRHDRECFSVYCYSYGKDDGSRYRLQIMRDCDRFIDVQGMSSPDIAQRIFEDRVCILVDLMGHTAGSRLDICALKPAPVQATYLGFPGTTGTRFMDYIITDKIVTPLAHEPYYSEKLVYMPHCYQANNDRQEIAVRRWRRKDLGLPEDGFVFSSFNQPVKIEPVMFNCWMKILSRVPDSVLWLLQDNRIAEYNLRQAALAANIQPDRLVFSEKLAKEEHLSRLRMADLGLDTRIYNGHTTTSDSIWGGIPVVTLIGAHFASRVSASLMRAAGIPEMITHSLTEYEDLAVSLATDANQLCRLKQKLATHRSTKPFFDTGRFVRDMEFAYKRMWRIYLNGEAPRRFEVCDIAEHL